MQTVAEKQETAVAVIPMSEVKESALSESVSEIEAQAQALTVTSDEEFDAASAFGRKVKSLASEVKEWFAPMKENAYNAHKAICSREKEMLDPLMKAEKIVKGSLGEYSMRKERERLAREAELRRLAQEEAERKLAEAEALEGEGNSEAAETALVEAQFAEDMSNSVYIPTEAPKASGVSQQKDWEIVSIDPSKVPVMCNNVMLRPVDEKAALKLIRFTKGAVNIPGIRFKEVIRTSLRK